MTKALGKPSVQHINAFNGIKNLNKTHQCIGTPLVKHGSLNKVSRLSVTMVTPACKTGVKIFYSNVKLT